MLDFRIYTFLTVCEYMNFTKAAQKLHITQPAVSQHIQYLEKLYDTELFIHEGKRIHLSPSGKVLLHTATTLKNDEISMLEQMKKTESHSIPFHFGVTLTIGEFAIAEPLAKYQKAHPKTDLHMTISNTNELLAKLQTGELNFALIEGYYEDASYDHIIFSTEDFIAVSSYDHKFEKQPINLEDLLSERLIVREPGSGTRDILEKNLDTRNLNINSFEHLSELGSINSIKEFVREDCGITFLYKIAVENELKNKLLKQIPLKDFSVNHNFTFIWNKGSVFSSQYEQICSELQSYIKQ